MLHKNLSELTELTALALSSLTKSVTYRVMWKSSHVMSTCLTDPVVIAVCCSLSCMHHVVCYVVCVRTKSGGDAATVSMLQRMHCG